MNTLWANLNPREQKLIMVATALIAVVLVVYVALLPGLRAASAADARLARATADHQEIKALAHALQARRSTMSATAGSDVRSGFDTIAAESGVQLISHSEQNGAHSLRISAPSSAAVLSFAAMAADSIGGGLTELVVSPSMSGLSASLTLIRPSA